MEHKHSYKAILNKKRNVKVKQHPVKQTEMQV
jgi:hypothetical protein